MTADWVWRLSSEEVASMEGARVRNRLRAHDALLKRYMEFSQEMDLEQGGKASRDILAKRLGASRGTITRWLSSPRYMTMDNLSMMLWAMDAELEFTPLNKRSKPMTDTLFHDWLEALAAELQTAGVAEDGKDYIAQTGIECWHDAWAEGDSPKDAAATEASYAAQDMN